MILRLLREQKKFIFLFMLFIITLEMFADWMGENLILCIWITFIGNLILVNQRMKKKEEEIMSKGRPDTVEPIDSSS